MLQNLKIVRDCYWAMPSGAHYMRDQNGNLSTLESGLYPRLNDNDAEYIAASNNLDLKYYGRLESSNMDTTAVYANIRAECTPPGSAILSINALQIGHIDFSGNADTYDGLFLLNDEQRERIHHSRILDNYDYFDIVLESDIAVDTTFVEPDFWMIAGDYTYTNDDYTGAISNGDPVGGWKSADLLNRWGVKQATPEYRPIYTTNVINGEPAIRFWNPSGMYLSSPTGGSFPLNATSGDIFIVYKMQDKPSEDTTLFGQYSSATNGAYMEIGPWASYNWMQLRWRINAGGAENWMSCGGPPTDYDPYYMSIQSDDYYYYPFPPLRTYPRGITYNCTAYSAMLGDTQGTWWGDINYVNKFMFVGGGRSDTGGTFDGYIAEIMGYNYPLDSGQLLSVKNYLYTKYNLGTGTYSGATARLYHAQIAYSGDNTWANHKIGLPNVHTETFYPTQIRFRAGHVWSGSIGDINGGVHASGVDDTFITNITQGSNTDFWEGSVPMPSGGLTLEFGDMSASVEAGTIYDEYGTAHGSGVGIGVHSFKNVTPSGWGGYSLAASGATGHAAMAQVLRVGSGDYSMTTWIKTTDTNTAYLPCMGAMRTGGSADRWYLGLGSTHKIRGFMEFPTAISINGTGSALNDGQWHHIAMVADRDANLTLYSDGSVDGTPSGISAYNGNDVSCTDQFMLGWAQGYTTRPIDMADCRVYRRALNAEDVANLASGVPITKQPVARWNFDRQIRQGINPITKITRAKLNMRMCMPYSGVYENARDTFEINGYNARYKNQDYIEELNVDTSQVPLNRKYGYYAYGAGGLVDYSGWRTYSTELHFLDPFQPSGNYKSIKHANIDMLTNMDFQLIGIPSGTKISAAELQVEYLPDEVLPLFTMGGDIYRCAASSTVDIGTDESYALGHGGWQHQGWRPSGNNVIEEDVFTNFYAFTNEYPLYTRTYPETAKQFYFTGNLNNTVYGTYVQNAPRDISGADGVVVPKIPQRREYYRNPISAVDLTPTYETSLRDITQIKPHNYRHMIYHGESLRYFDADLDSIDENELATEDICQVYFGQRLTLTEDFTLYFALYRDYGFHSYGRFFHRGLTSNNGTENYEIYGDIETNKVRFTVQGADGQDQKVEVEIDYNTKEPILIWFSCGYETTASGKTTMILNVHDDVNNYFVNDWHRASRSFTGRRKRYTSGVVTALGTLETLDFLEQLSRKLYLHRVSPVEFGYANEYIDLDYTTSDSTTQLGYDTSQDKDKYFLRSRIATNQYLQPNPSGVRWFVPQGSGAAFWSTAYNMFDWASSGNIHSIYNPVSTAGTNYSIAPSAIYVDMDITHSTNHPSGLLVDLDVEFDSLTQDNWKVARAEFVVPSGGGVWSTYAPIKYKKGANKHIGMDKGPINIAELDNINVTLTTKYHSIGESGYYGNVVIHGMRVYFDVFCEPITIIDSISLYTTADPAQPTKNINLFTEGHITVPSTYDDGTLDLYTSGRSTSVSSSGDPLYPSGLLLYIDTGYASDNTSMNLFTRGPDLFAYSGEVTPSLYVWGTPAGVDGIWDKTELYIRSDYDPRYTLPLFIDAGTGSVNTSMNLFLDNHPAKATNLPSGLPLFIDGPSPTTNNLSLFIITPSGTEGAVPTNADMNLFIARDSEATTTLLPLYLAQYDVTGTVNLSLTGVEIPASSVPMFIQGSGLPTTAITELFTHGF